MVRRHLTDSIAAVEAAWGKVAKDIGQDPEYHEIEAEVERFENTILYYAMLPHHGGSTPASNEDADRVHPIYPISEESSTANSSDATPELTPGPTAPSSRRSSTSRRSSAVGRRPSFDTRRRSFEDDEDVIRVGSNDEFEKANSNQARPPRAWQTEAASVDRSVRILPGVRKMIDSLPEGDTPSPPLALKHMVPYGCMKRVGITPPAVTITADDKRLKAGKPAPDPFLLAAECLGYDAKRCVVFEDSPSGIRAGVASGATVIAVCTSHERAKIEGCGAHYIVENMEKVHCVVEETAG
ncbi:HAD-like protein [Pholiota molesta]|nr:HAD-like protein [Pholiota molesta]